jgi:hypothetical protein
MQDYIMCNLELSDNILTDIKNKRLNVSSELIVDPYSFFDIDDILNISESSKYSFFLGMFIFLSKRYSKEIKMENVDKIDNIKKENVEIKMTYKDYNYVKKSELKDKIKANCLGTAKLLGFLKKIVDKNSALILHYGNYVTKKTTNVKYLYQGNSIVNCDTDTLKYEELQLIPISLDKLQEKIEDNIKRVSVDKYQSEEKDLKQSNKKNNNNNNSNNNNNNRKQNFPKNKGGHFGNYNGKYHYNNRFSNYSYNYKNYNHNKSNPSNKNRSGYYKGNVIEVEVGNNIPNGDKDADVKNDDKNSNNSHNGSNNNNNNDDNSNKSHGNISHYHFEPGDKEVNLDE